jgi:hypothetical protein
MASSPAPTPSATRAFLDEHEMARIETATVTTSLSPESARLVRIERIIRAKPNPADQARARGFYDFMLGHQNQAAAQGVRLSVSYQQGWEKGQQRRVALNGRAWYETEKARSNGKWSWRIYREGYFQLEGNAPSETRADQQIEDSKADLMDLHGDWGAPSRPSPSAETLDEDEVAAPRA